MAEIGARWWLASEDRIGKERAVELLVGLAWRGISGAPLHPEGAADGSADG
jgi:hypothetical protein